LSRPWPPGSGGACQDVISHGHPVPETRGRASIDDVSFYVDGDSRDPWKTRMETICRPDGGFGVVSAGPDGSFDTADDIHSWDPVPSEQR
jgi:hypothetical protein